MAWAASILSPLTPSHTVCALIVRIRALDIIFVAAGLVPFRLSGVCSHATLFVSVPLPFSLAFCQHSREPPPPRHAAAHFFNAHTAPRDAPRTVGCARYRTAASPFIAFPLHFQYSMLSGLHWHSLFAGASSPTDACHRQPSRWWRFGSRARR